MRKHVVTVAGLALAAFVAHAAPTKDPKDLAGTWTLDEGSSDDPVRVLRGERGRGRDGRVVFSGASVFGVPVGSPERRAESGDELEEGELAGVEHVFEATYRLGIRREGDVTEIHYGTEPTITYRDGVKAERDGAVARAEWQGGVLTVEHQLANGSLVSERYWVEARSGELRWTTELTRRKGSVDVERLFYRSPAAEQ
ncbi:MAG TPA: hypothetical protein VKA43_10585 [Gammaproteobacteria bacterium]|nr:hypothetical protein [Gammaproteobacteria bacterium]